MRVLKSGKGMRTKALIVAFSMSVLSPVSAAAENLADALAAAYRNSDLLEQNRALLRAADEDVAITLAGLRPVLDFIVSASRSLNETSVNGVVVTDRQVTAGTVTLRYSQVLWDNLRTTRNRQAADALVLATREGLRSVEQQVLFRAVIAYMQVLSTNEFLSLAQNNLRLLQQELRAAQDRFEVGEVTRTDVALAEARLAESRSRLATAQGNQVNARQEYLAAVGNLPGNLAPPPSLPARPASIEAGKAEALRRHPDVQQAQFQVEAAEFTVLSAESNLGPTVSLNADVGFTESRNNVSDQESASLSLTYNQRLYQGGALAAGVRRAMASRDAARSSLLFVQDSIAQDVATALVRLEVARANIQATDRQIQASEVAFRGVREEATLGARTTLDVLDAEQELLEARAARISAQSELYIAAYQILAAQGALTAENLNLDVPIYDVSAYYDQVKNAPAYFSRQGQQLDRVLKSLGRN